jgi:HlyD family secretion protein
MPPAGGTVEIVMDIQREGAGRRRLIRNVVIGVVVAAVVVAVTIVVSRLKPAAPTVERATVWTDTVKRGPMVREVSGLGSLVPEQILWIPAIMGGRVERINVLPGALVKADTELLVLNNPELQLSALGAEYDVKSAEANLKNLEVQLESQRLSQQSALATVQSSYQQAHMQAAQNTALNKAGLLVDLQLQLSLSNEADWANRKKIEEQRMAIQSDSIAAQIAVQRGLSDQLRAVAALKREQVASLRVRAGAEGVLQEVPVQVGQTAGAGTILAKVVQPQKLKAELKISETQAKDVQIGQKVKVDTRNGIIAGLVSRIDPSVREGTVTVDVKLEGALPPGARPDLSVDGTIELEHLDNVVYVGRPATGQPNSTISLFRLGPDGREASRVAVKLGRSSVSVIEVVEGLRPGDKVILSDMSQWDAQERVRLN